MMLADIKAGRNLAPRARNLKASPELFLPGATVIDNVGGLFRAKDVAVSLIAAGERSQAEYLLEAVATAARSHPEARYRFILAKVHVARGDRTAFFQTRRSLVETEGPQEWYYNDPEFAVYRNEPEFRTLFGDLPQKLADRLATIRRMEAAGEFAPIPPRPVGKK